MSPEDWLSRWKDRPWVELDMTSKKWLTVPAVAIMPEIITPTQAQVYFNDGGTSFSRDAYPHVVAYKDGIYLDDGHHRVAKAIELGLPLIAARLLIVVSY